MRDRRLPHHEYTGARPAPPPPNLRKVRNPNNKCGLGGSLESLRSCVAPGTEIPGPGSAEDEGENRDYLQPLYREQPYQSMHIGVHTLTWAHGHAGTRAHTDTRAHIHSTHSHTYAYTPAHICIYTCISTHKLYKNTCA